MKIRLDYVTNSSSSSFILKDNSSKLIREAVSNRLSIEPRDEWEMQDYELARSWTSEIIGEPFGEHRIDDLREVYEWYRNELLCRILGVAYWTSWAEYDDWIDKVKAVVSEKWQEVEIKEKLSAVFTLDIYERILWNNGIEEPKGGSIIIYQEHLETYIWEFISSWNIDHNVLYRFYLDNLEEILKYAKRFDKRSYADVMEYLFDAPYLYFDEVETHYLICEALRDADFCTYSCGHMG